MSEIRFTTFETPLGSMIGIGNSCIIYRIDFTDNPDLTKEITQLSRNFNSEIQEGSTDALNLLKKEMADYFSGNLKKFTVLTMPLGTSFQKHVWTTLAKVPYGTTQSYADIAKSINSPTSFRAVANANGSNPIAIIIPCHRIIKSSGDLCGYRCGVERKKWLLKHEHFYRDHPLALPDFI